MGTLLSCPPKHRGSQSQCTNGSNRNMLLHPPCCQPLDGKCRVRCWLKGNTPAELCPGIDWREERLRKITSWKDQLLLSSFQQQRTTATVGNRICKAKTECGISPEKHTLISASFSRLFGSSIALKCNLFPFFGPLLLPRIALCLISLFVIPLAIST